MYLQKLDSFGLPSSYCFSFLNGQEEVIDMHLKIWGCRGRGHSGGRSITLLLPLSFYIRASNKNSSIFNFNGIGVKDFLKKLLLFLSVLVLLTVVGVLLPATPRASTSHLFFKLKMDSLLKNVKPPRLILLGGSNLSLSINSELLKDSLHLNPINTGISWDIGFQYMFDNTVKYVRPGDIIVASLEYEQFYDGKMFGGEHLLRTIFDVAPGEFFQLNFKQYVRMFPGIPYYAISKYNVGEYFFERDPSEIYDRGSINQYGDNCKHWSLPSKIVPVSDPLPAEYDEQAFDKLEEFESEIKAKGATLLFTFPALQESSFEIRKEGIKAIENAFRKRDFILVGSPERYLMPDALLFDNPYHLIKAGVDVRTNLLIQDLRQFLIPANEPVNMGVQ